MLEKLKKRKKRILIVKTKDSLDIVNELIFSKNSEAQPVTPSFDSFETAKAWLKNNKAKLKDGQYFLASVDSNGKVTLEKKIK